MSGHEWTHDSGQAGPADASMTPDGPVQSADDDASSVVRSRRFPRVSLDLRGLSLQRFRRKPRPAPAADVDAPAEQSAGSEEPRPRSRRINWNRLSMANTKRETRVGLAALASFLILVIALIISRSSDRPAVAMNIPGDSATKGSGDHPEAKDDTKPDPKNEAGKTTPGPTVVSARDDKQESPPRPTEPIERTSHDGLTKPEDPKAPVTKSDQPAASPSNVAVKKPEDRPEPPAASPPVVAVKKPVETPGQTEPVKPTPIALPEPGPDLPPLIPSAAIAGSAGPDAKVKTDPPDLPPVAPSPLEAAKVATPPPTPPTIDLPPKLGTEPPASPAPAVTGTLPPIKPVDLPAPAALPVEPPTTALQKAPDAKAGSPAASQDLISGIVGVAPEPKGPPPANPPPPSTKPATDLPPVAVPPVAVPPATLKPLDELPLHAEPVSQPVTEPVRPQPPPTPPVEHVSPPVAEPGPTPTKVLPPLTPAPVPAEVETTAAAVASAGSRTIPTLGKIRPVEVGTESRLTADEARVADAPSPREPVGAREQVDPILHTVQRGENFWTISRNYYGSGRYYRALHAANVKLVPDIKELYVGSTIKVPPVESLDRNLFDPPSRASLAEVASTRDVQVAASTRTPRPDDGRAVPTRPRVDVELGMPTTRPKRAGVRDEVDEPTRPTYRVRAHDTLRSIARDTLGDSHRYREILDLNREVIDDPTRLVSGQSLTLPEDAIVRDRPR
jgi:nucleoid-associated protein YgaU